MGDDGRDRRRGERVPINAEFEDLASEGATFVGDLSEHGVFVHTRHKLPIGTNIELRFTVLLDDPVLIQGLGTVVRVQDDPIGLGVEFGPMSPEMVLRLQDALARKRPVPSGDPVEQPPPAPERVALPPIDRLQARQVGARAMSEEEFEKAQTGAFTTLNVQIVDEGDIEEIDDEEAAAMEEDDKTRPIPPLRKRGPKKGG